MQERLAGAENNTESLAKMLLELGISPTTAANDNRYKFISCHINILFHINKSL